MTLLSRDRSVIDSILFTVTASAVQNLRLCQCYRSSQARGLAPDIRHVNLEFEQVQKWTRLETDITNNLKVRQKELVSRIHGNNLPQTSLEVDTQATQCTSLYGSEHKAQSEVL